MLDQILEELGPSLSSVLVERLVTAGVTAEAARKRVSRAVAGGRICRLRGLRFKHGESFLYTQQQRESSIFMERVWDTLVSERSATINALYALHARGGLAPKRHFQTFSGSPLKLNGHLSSDRVLEFLIEYSLVRERELGDLGLCLELNESLPLDVTPSTSRLKARLVAERILIDYLTDWLRRITLTSFDSTYARDGQELPQFGQFLWDITAPSYAFPLAQRVPGSDPKPGFVVADVLLAGTVTAPHAEYFLQKCSIMRHQRNTRPFMAWLVTDGFDRVAFAKLKRVGIMPVTVQNLLGNPMAEALKALIDTLTHAAAVVAQRPEAIGELFSKLGAIEGAAGNIRGPLFELIVAHSVREREGNSVDIGRLIRCPESGQPTDIDVLRVKERQEVCAYECKGHGPGVIVGVDEVRMWLNQTIPRTRSYLRAREQFANARQIFEFWTTGTFTKEAIALLNADSQRIRKYRVGWRDSESVLNYVREIGNKRLVDVLKEQYLQHQVARSVQRTATDRPTARSA